MKKLVAYSSVTHMGFIMLGLFAGTVTSTQGALLQMVNHGLSTGALFLLVGVIYDRRHTRMIEDFGGLAAVMPLYTGRVPDRHPGSIGLPGPQRLRRRVPDPDRLLRHATRPRWCSPRPGSCSARSTCSRWSSGCSGTRSATRRTGRLPDLTWQEMLAFAPLAVLMVWIGVHPGTFLSLSEAAVRRLIGG